MHTSEYSMTSKRRKSLETNKEHVHDVRKKDGSLKKYIKEMDHHDIYSHCTYRNVIFILILVIESIPFPCILCHILSDAVSVEEF